VNEHGREIPDPSPFDFDAWAEQFESMTWFKRIRFLAEGGAHFVAGLLESAADEAAAVVVRTRKSFRQGLDPNILDAHVLDERPAPGEARGAATPSRILSAGNEPDA
jgi:hypothetical protein